MLSSTAGGGEVSLALGEAKREGSFTCVNLQLIYNSRQQINIIEQLLLINVIEQVL
jgi:hypothetical protein